MADEDEPRALPTLVTRIPRPGTGRGSSDEFSLLPFPYALLPTPYPLLPTPYPLLPTPYTLSTPPQQITVALRHQVCLRYAQHRAIVLYLRE